MKGREKFKTYTGYIPEIKSSGKYKEHPQISSFGDGIEEYRGAVLGNGLDISLMIPLQLCIWQTIKTCYHKYLILNASQKM